MLQFILHFVGQLNNTKFFR